jgi:hypothetical protein
VPDVVDNCPNEVNADQEDTDGDGIGNVCDTTNETTTTTTPYMDCVLDIYVSPPQGGTTYPKPGSHFIQGCTPKNHTVDAIPNTGFKFSHWGKGDGSISYENPIAIELLVDPSSIIAVFDKLKYPPNILPTVLIGEYTCRANPCVSISCLPGVIWSVTSENDIYYLTKDWEWLWGCEATSWNGYVPKEGDIVIVVGEESEATDNQDNPYINIEVEYLFPITCPVEEIYGKVSEPTELLRDFRDKMLKKTPEGQELIRLYYKWSPLILRAMEEDEEFKEEVKKMIDGILPLIE